ncbi:MAG: hypothetical protein N2560_02490 [Ignavibacteria bacterium]|nr:hypothetical protein [Ignavibacteria bacterium]
MFEPKQDVNISAVASFDPNEIVGPAGLTITNYVTDNFGLTYTIYFENLRNAIAPTHEVIIVDTLDPNIFDFKTFSFGRVSWGNERINPLPNMKEFSIDISLKPKNPNILRINAKFDTTSGIVYCHFIILYTVTMDFPEDPDGGFLLPKKTPPEGEGSVKFTINLKKGLTHNTKILNQAKITLDLNPPINTNIYSNQLDLKPPVSRLTNIYKINYMEPNTYLNTGTASDDASGVKYRTLFASINNREYFPLATMATDEIFLKLEPDSVYKFFYITVDSVGNIESNKTIPEVSTLNVSVASKETYTDFGIKVYPNPAQDYLDITCIVPESGELVIFINDLSGRTLLFENLGFLPEVNQHLDCQHKN